jgi:hypothetical protein
VPHFSWIIDIYTKYIIQADHLSPTTSQNVYSFLYTVLQKYLHGRKGFRHTRHKTTDILHREARKLGVVKMAQKLFLHKILIFWYGYQNNPKFYADFKTVKTNGQNLQTKVIGKTSVLNWNLSSSTVLDSFPTCKDNLSYNIHIGIKLKTVLWLYFCIEPLVEETVICLPSVPFSFVSTVFPFKFFLHFYNFKDTQYWHTYSSHPPFNTPPPQPSQLKWKVNTISQHGRQKRHKINPNTDKTDMVGHVKTCTYFVMISE